MRRDHTAGSGRYAGDVDDRTVAGYIHGQTTTEKRCRAEYHLGLQGDQPDDIAVSDQDPQELGKLKRTPADVSRSHRPQQNGHDDVLCQLTRLR